VKRNTMIVAAVLLLAVLAVYRSTAAKESVRPLPTEVAAKPGFIAPSIQLQDTIGKTYNIGGKRDKPVMVNFWASWCGPCEVEAPDLISMHEKYKDKFDLYAINATKYDFKDSIDNFLKLYPYPFPVLMDKKGDAYDLYRIKAFPTTFLIDRNGVIVDAFAALSPKELERRIKRLIEQ
jgi:thiol-disulfide isomerase/thioredoxin